MKRLTRWAVLGMLLLIAAGVLADKNQEPTNGSDRGAVAPSTPEPPVAPTASVTPRPSAAPTPDPADLEDDHAREREQPKPRWPLRRLLPVQLAGTRIEPVLRHRNTVRIIPGDGGRRAARAIYDRAKAATADRSNYTIRWGRR